MVVLDPEHVPDIVSDATLVIDAQRGSSEAFAALYERHHPRILRHCRNRIGSNDAADAAQETFLRAWRAIEGFGGEGRVYPWLRTIATNVCIDTLRRRSRSFPVAEVEGVPAADHVELAPLTMHTDAITAALARISDRHRSVLHLREYEGWSYERIADHEQLDLSAVKSLLWRARQSLRREFLVVSAEGRLAALGGLLSLARLREAVSALIGATAPLGASGTAAAVAAVAAVVAVPVLAVGPSAPAAIERPAPVVTNAPPAAPITVSGAVFRAAAPLVQTSTTPASVVPSTTTTTTAVVVAQEDGRPATPEHEPVEVHANAEHEQVNREARAERPPAKEHQRAEKEQARSERGMANETAKEQHGEGEDRPGGGDGGRVVTRHPERAES